MTSSPNTKFEGTEIAENDFFSSVASHDLERFHSECLAWLFNAFPDFANAFIQKFASKPGVFKRAFTEVEQLDLVLYYQVGAENRAVIIENKVKASEGQREISLEKAKSYFSDDVLKEELHARLVNQKYKLSQTEFYYLRGSAKKSFDDRFAHISGHTGIVICNDAPPESTAPRKTNTAEGNKGASSLVVLKKNCDFIFLIPANVDINRISPQINKKPAGFNKEKRNKWNLTTDPFSENKWTTITYLDLLESFITRESAAQELTADELLRNKQLLFARSYISFMFRQCDLWQAQLDNQFVNYNPSEYGASQYLEVLASLLMDRFDIKPKIDVISGSARNPEPLIHIEVTDKISVPAELFTSKSDTNPSPTFSLGVQIQGSRVKIYLSAGEHYDHIEIKSKQKYADFFWERLTQSNRFKQEGNNFSITLEDGRIEKLKKVNAKTKSFTDYCFHRSLFELSEGLDPKPIHAKELFIFRLVHLLQTKCSQ